MNYLRVNDTPGKGFPFVTFSLSEFGGPQIHVFMTGVTPQMLRETAAALEAAIASHLEASA